MYVDICLYQYLNKGIKRKIKQGQNDLIQDYVRLIAWVSEGGEEERGCQELKLDWPSLQVKDLVLLFCVCPP